MIGEHSTPIGKDFMLHLFLFCFGCFGRQDVPVSFMDSSTFLIGIPPLIFIMIKERDYIINWGHFHLWSIETISYEAYIMLTAK